MTRRDDCTPDPSSVFAIFRVEFPTRRGTLTAIDDVSFDIAPGEVLGVVGESGAGKSITGTAIIGLIEPPGRIAGGEVLLRGMRIDNLPPRRNAQNPRQAHRHGVPGSAHQPQSALPHRRPAGRNHHDAHQPLGIAGAQQGARAARPKSAFPRRRRASTPIRINFPAACASASCWRLRSQPSRNS